MKSEVQATEGCVLWPKVCCQWCFQCWQKEACSLLPRICSWLHYSRETMMRRWVGKIWRNTVKEESKPNAFSSSQSDSFLLLTTDCDFLSCLGLSLQARKCLSWSFQAIPYSDFYMQCYQEKLQAVGAFSSCMTYSLSGFARGLPLILNNIHSQIIRNDIVGGYNADWEVTGTAVLEKLTVFEEVTWWIHSSSCERWMEKVLVLRGTWTQVQFVRSTSNNWQWTGAIYNCSQRNKFIPYKPSFAWFSIGSIDCTAQPHQCKRAA